MTRVRSENKRNSFNLQKQHHVRAVERQITILTTVRTVGTVLESLVGTRSTAHDRSKPPGNIYMDCATHWEHSFWQGSLLPKRIKNHTRLAGHRH